MAQFTACSRTLTGRAGHLGSSFGQQVGVLRTQIECTWPRRRALHVTRARFDKNQDRSRKGKSYESKKRRRGRAEWLRSPDDTPFRDGNRDRLIGLLTLRAARTLAYYLSELNPNVYHWLVVFMKENPIPTDGTWDDVSGETFLRKLLSMPIENAKYNTGRGAMYDRNPGCGVDPRNLAQRIMEIRSVIAKEMITDLSDVAEENSALMRETIQMSFMLSLDNVASHPVDKADSVETATSQPVDEAAAQAVEPETAAPEAASDVKTSPTEPAAEPASNKEAEAAQAVEPETAAPEVTSDVEATVTEPAAEPASDKETEAAQAVEPETAPPEVASEVTATETEPAAEPASDKEAVAAQAVEPETTAPEVTSDVEATATEPAAEPALDKDADAAQAVEPENAALEAASDMEATPAEPVAESALDKEAEAAQAVEPEPAAPEVASDVQVTETAAEPEAAAEHVETAASEHVNNVARLENLFSMPVEDKADNVDPKP